MAHHLQALVIIARPTIGIPILRLATLVERDFAFAMSTVDSHERLPLRFEHVLCRVFKPAVDEVAVKTIAITNLSYLLTKGLVGKQCREREDHTSPQASLKGGMPLQPPGIAALVLYLTENLKLGILFIPAGQVPPELAAAYAYSDNLFGLTQSGNLHEISSSV